MKESNRLLKDIVTYIAFLIVLTIALSSSFIIPNFYNHFSDNPSSDTKLIDDYINSNKDYFVEKIVFNDITEVVTKDSKYNSKWFDTNTGEKLDISSFMCDQEGFTNKVNELLSLKYPRFISEVLSTNSNNVYYFKDNELVIYYYDYVIEPMPNEELLLHVNYNEIKDYLKIETKLDVKYINENGFVIDPNKKHIALTFDDGPGKYTSNLVGYLNDGFAHATFFMQGKNLNSYKEAVIDVNNQGSEVAYHSYAHKYFTKQTVAEIRSDLEKSNNILTSIIGETFKLVRPPYGSISDETKTTLNMPFILWNIDTEDWKNKDSEYLKNYVLEHITENDIILFHDIHETSVEAIPELLKELYVRGYQVVTVSELASINNKTLEAGVAYRSMK